MIDVDKARALVVRMRRVGARHSHASIAYNDVGAKLDQHCAATLAAQANKFAADLEALLPDAPNVGGR